MPSEEFHNSHQESLRPEQEAAAALGEVALQDPTPTEQTDAQSDNEGRWDYDKAETMAAVLQAPGQDYQRVDGDFKRVDVPASSLFNKARLSKIRPYESVWQEDVDRHDNHLSELRRALDDSEAPDYRKSEAKAEIERTNERLTNDVDTLMSPFESFYEMNPGLFAEMPTRAFMDMAKQYEHTMGHIEQVEAVAAYLASVSRQYGKMLEAGEGGPHYADRLAADVSDLFSTGTKAAYDYLKKLPEAHGHKATLGSMRANLELLFESPEDSFTMSPKALLQKQLGIFEELTNVGEVSLEELRARRQILEDEAKAGTTASSYGSSSPTA